jgi:hypothetical protein
MKQKEARQLHEKIPPAKPLTSIPEFEPYTGLLVLSVCGSSTVVQNVIGVEVFEEMKRTSLSGKILSVTQKAKLVLNSVHSLSTSMCKQFLSFFTLAYMRL